jgi:hypothetical protein
LFVNDFGYPRGASQVVTDRDCLIARFGAP